MKQFLKFVIATVIGLVLFIGIIFIVLASSVKNISKEKPIVVQATSVLHLKLNYAIRDKTSDNPFEQLAGLSPDMSVPVGLKDILAQIKRAKDDDKIKGIFLDLSAVGTGYAKTSEIRDAITEFKDSGKPVHAYAENYTNKSYYLATVADKIHMNPEGNLFFNGMSSGVMFYKDMLKKVGVEMQVIKRGKFKGAVEPFILDELSEENKLQIQSYVGSIYEEMLKGISESRSIPSDSLKAIADQFKVRNSKQALSYRMIDAVSFRDQVLSQMRSDMALGDGDINFLAINKYRKSEPQKSSSDKIAVVFAEGSIVSGGGEEYEVGSDRFAKALKNAREDENVKAVVLRVNSPGGSAQASEVILREAILLNKEKPLIVSMGDVAASGGYYISCLADSIVAKPNTITGSIGVFGMIPNAEGLFDKMGLHTEYVGTGEFSDFGRLDRAWNEKELNIIDQLVGEVYDKFLGHVADGRGMTVEQVDEIGQGRVWTGEMAKERGLVDVLGGLDKAMEIAAYKAGLESYGVTSYPKDKDPFEKILEVFDMSVLSQKIIAKELGSDYELYRKVKEIREIEGVQAILPYHIDLN